MYTVLLKILEEIVELQWPQGVLKILFKNDKKLATF